MTRLALIALAAGALLAGCDKPKPEDCRKALLNMQHLLGTENLTETSALEGEVRRCRGGSKRKAVECAIKAQTIDELRACDFYKLPDKGVKGGATPAPSGSAGSAAAPAGSAAAGSAAPAGSAAAGSAAPAGSAAAPAGSAAAPAGSAAAPAGSAAHAGSAAPAGSAAAAGSAGSAK